MGEVYSWQWQLIVYMDGYTGRIPRVSLVGGDPGATLQEKVVPALPMVVTKAVLCV